MEKRKPAGLLNSNPLGFLQNPLFLSGAATFDAASRNEPIGPAMAQGLRAGHEAQVAQQRQQAIADEQTQRARWAELSKGNPLLQMLGPQAGAKHLLSQGQAAKPTAFMQNYSFARQHGFKGSPADFKRAGRTQINISGQEKSFDKEMGKQLAKEFVSAQQAGAKASRDLSDLETMSQALEDPNLYTGSGGQAIQFLKRAGKTLFNADLKGVASGEVVDRVAKKIALSFKSELPGPMSDSDREFLQSLPANLSTSTEGNRQVIELGMAKRRWEIERAQAVQQYASRNQGRLSPEVYSDLSAVDNKWNQHMSSLITRMRQDAPVVQRSPGAGLPDFSKGGRFKVDADGNIVGGN